jgi:hypothetical protein
MNNFIVNLSVEDCFTDSSCCKNCSSKEVVISNTSQVVNLFDSYILNVVRVTSTYFTVIIQNGVNVIIRNVFTSYRLNVVLPTNDNCSKHIVTIGGTITPST